MIIPILGEAPPRLPITTKLLMFDQFLTEIMPPDVDFRDGIILLYPEPENEELPSYLRSEITQYLKTLKSMAAQWNAAIIIPDIVQKQLLMSNRVYPGLNKVIRPKDDKNATKSISVDVAEGKVGFLEGEKLLLLEMLLGASPSRLELERVVLTLRKHKVYCMELKGAPPGTRYKIIKFDSPSAINKEFKNFNEIRKLFYDNPDINSISDLETWRDKTYMLFSPQGQDYDLFKIISSTVVTAGEEEDWTHQTLKDQWNKIIENNVAIKIIDDAFNTLKILYRKGFQSQTLSSPRTRSVGEIYWTFYKGHIMPVDCVIRCDLNNITSGKFEVGGSLSKVYPPKTGEIFAGNGYSIKEIKLKANRDDEEGGQPEISLVVENEELEKKRLIELKLGMLGDFQPRRELYLTKIREGADLPPFRGRSENNFEDSLKKSISGITLRHPEFGTERVIRERYEKGELDGTHISFISGDVAANPLYFYSQIYNNPENPAVALSFESLSTWIHGDLNVGNIITTPMGDAKIIDFARLVKDGPLEFDFAELEVDIRIRNLVAECRKMRDEKESLSTIVKELFLFEKGLLEVFTGSETEEDLARRVMKRFQPGFLVIAKIRKKLIEIYSELTGRAVSGTDVLIAYMTAIYFESLAALNFGIEPLARTWALITATVACAELFQTDMGKGNALRGPRPILSSTL